MPTKKHTQVVGNFLQSLSIFSKNKEWYNIKHRKWNFTWFSSSHNDFTLLLAAWNRNHSTVKKYSQNTHTYTQIIVNRDCLSELWMNNNNSACNNCILFATWHNEIWKAKQIKWKSKANKWNADDTNN
jgi:hypothetical protein